MKRAGICLRMMLKRMGKHPVYWILLLLFPAAIFAVPGFNNAAEEQQILAGYAVEEAKQADSGEKALYGGRGVMGLLEDKMGEEGLFRYIKYGDRHEMQEDIVTGKLSCGIFFDGEFPERLEEQDYRYCITLYLPEGMNVGGMVQEDIFRRVYQTHSAVWYAELLEERGCQIKPEEVLQKFSEYQKEGKVFKVDYEVCKKSAKKPSGAEENTENMQGPGADASDTAGRERGVSVLSLRSILAFLTLLSASMGALDAARDRKRNSGDGIICRCTLSMAAAGAPILPATLFLAGGMLFQRLGMTGLSDKILPEIGSALLYGFVLWLFAVLVGRFISVKLLEGMMPCFLLAVLLCCPIFFNLGDTIPLISCLSKLFPVTWYLEAW